MTTVKKPEHYLLLVWFIYMGAVIFGLYVAWQQGFMRVLFHSDKSYLSYAIALLFILASLHGAWLIFRLSTQIRFANQIEKLLDQHIDLSVDGTRIRAGRFSLLPDCFVTEYLSDLLRATIKGQLEESSASRSDLLEVYTNRLIGPHELGWFIVEVMIKLGLLGTIVGFIMMLGSVADTASFDVSTMQKILSEMTIGMGTALYTTLAGLSGSMLLATIYHFIDRGADELIEKTVNLTEVHIVPRLSITR